MYESCQIGKKNCTEDSSVLVYKEDREFSAVLSRKKFEESLLVIYKSARHGYHIYHFLNWYLDSWLCVIYKEQSKMHYFITSQEKKQAVSMEYLASSARMCFWGEKRDFAFQVKEEPCGSYRSCQRELQRYVSGNGTYLIC